MHQRITLADSKYNDHPIKARDAQTEVFLTPPEEFGRVEEKSTRDLKKQAHACKRHYGASQLVAQAILMAIDTLQTDSQTTCVRVHVL